MSIDIKKSRFRDASWFDKVDTLETPIIVGGVGGIGSWLIILLTRILGPKSSIIIYDFDDVEEVNIAGQFFTQDGIGTSKVKAIADLARDFSNYSNIETEKTKYDKGSYCSPIMFSAFDNMSSRKDMFENWKKEVLKNPLDKSIFIDGRLLAEQFQVFFVTPDKIPSYEKYLFEDSEVISESCSYKQTTHFAAAIAAKMIQGFTNWLSGDVSVVPFYYEEIGSLFINNTTE